VTWLKVYSSSIEHRYIYIRERERAEYPRIQKKKGKKRRKSCHNCSDWKGGATDLKIAEAEISTQLQNGT